VRQRGVKINALGAALALCATSAVAQGELRDPAAAQALFDEARALVRAQRFSEACPKLAESQRLDPGIGTQFHLADCYERQGKLASAWANFLEVVSQARASGQSEREKLATRRAAKLEPRLSKLRIVVPALNQIAGLNIQRDGIPVGAAQWDTSLPVDPGEYEIIAAAPERRSFVKKVRVEAGTVATLEIPELEATAPSAPALAPVRPAKPATRRAAPHATRSVRKPASDDRGTGETSSGSNGWVIALGTTGLVGVGAGTALGLMARSKYEESKDHCASSNENLCSAKGVDRRDDAFVLGNASTVGFIIGGVALAGAGVLWLTSGSAKPSQARVRDVRVGVTRGAVILRGQF
jgi:hypothetical protein